MINRANDPVIKDLLYQLASRNVQNPEFNAIKKILENGVGDRYVSYAIQMCLDDPCRFIPDGRELAADELSCPRCGADPVDTCAICEDGHYINIHISKPTPKFCLYHEYPNVRIIKVTRFCHRHWWNSDGASGDWA